MSGETWRVVEGRSCYRILAANGDEIATCWSRPEADKMAAAPALVEALADAEEVLSAAAAGWDVKPTDILKALDAASAALRAARGETKEPESDRAICCTFCGRDRFTVRVSNGKVFCELCMKEVPQP